MSSGQSFGFYTRSDRTAASSAKLPMAVDRLHQLECRACPLNTVRSEHPKLGPSGSSHPDVYILGEQPREEEDERGRHFAGSAGTRLRDEIPDGHKIRWNTTIRDRTPGDRDPKLVETECCRPSIERDIVSSKPRVVVAVGKFAVEWFGASGGEQLWRGRRFPARVTASNGTHDVWVSPIMPPDWIRAKEGGRDEGGELEKELTRWYGHDVRRAFETAKWKPPRILTGDELLKGLRLLNTAAEIRELPSILAEFFKAPRITLDFETNKLRPYYAGAKILTCSISDGTLTTAFPLNHSQAPASGERALWEFLRAYKGRIAAHNAQFDMEQGCVLGPEWLIEKDWDCTQAQAHVLDERQGGLSLDFLMQLHFGLRIKSLSKLDKNNLDDEPLEAVLRYNGLDAIGDFHLLRRQTALLERQGLLPVYEFHRKRIPALVASQKIGMPVDIPAVRAKKTDFDTRIAEVERRIEVDPDIKAFRRMFGQFNAKSNPDVVKLLTKVMKRTECKTAKGGYSADEETLNKVGEPICKAILKHRKLCKLSSTYAEPFLPESPDSVTFPDGRIHTQLNHTATVTSRTSSDQPNMQNFPKRMNKEARAIIVAPKGWKIVSCDYGQVEYRVIAQLAKDKASIEAIKKRFDIHMFWATRISEIWPDILRKHRKRVLKEAKEKLAKADVEKLTMKSFRADVKNQFVFPSFYLAGERSVANYLGIPYETVHEFFPEFWEHHAGVKAWQQKLVDAYRKNGFVELATGRRRRYPLGRSMIVNTPVQGSASEIVIDAHTRMWELSRKRKEPWLTPALNIHDDLTFLIPNELVDSAIKIIVGTMLKHSFPWMKVPLSVEVETGDNWAEMKKYGDYFSDAA